MAYNSDYEIRLAQLEAMGGDVTGKTYNSVYDIDLEILRLTEEGGGGSGVTNLMQSVTYEQLKTLRDNSTLIKGQQYRITDFVTTINSDIDDMYRSAGHQFDIIVTADDVNKLNENARAIQHPVEAGESETFNAMQVLDDTSYYLYKRYPEGDTNGEYAWAYLNYGDGLAFVADIHNPNVDWSEIDTSDLIMTTTLTPTVGDTLDMGGTDVTLTQFGSVTIGVPTVYYKWEWDDLGSYILTSGNQYTNSVAGTCEIDCPLYDEDYYTTAYPIDGFVAIGELPYINPRKVVLKTENGNIVLGDYIDEDKWNEWLDDGDVEGAYPEWFVGKYFVDYENVSSAGTMTIPGDYFDGCSLNAWELKYCLDNDTNRFSWAQAGNAGLGFAAIKFGDSESSSIAQRYSEGDNTNGYAWALVDGSGDIDIDDANWNDVDTDFIIYTETENPSIGDTVSGNGVGTVLDYKENVGAVPSGKGVIYYMKDEWNNEAPYDFKNVVIDNDGGYFAYGDEVGFTFGNLNYANNPVDGTLDGSSRDNIIVANVSNSDIPFQCFGENKHNYNPFGKTYTAGNNIQINGTTISATDTKYFAGEGLSLDTNSFRISDDLQYYLFILGKQHRPENLINEYLTIECLGNNGDLRFKTNNIEHARTIEYSFDKINWTSVTSDVYNNGTLISNLKWGEKVYLRGNNDSYYDYIKSVEYYNYFSTTCKICVYGNIMSLVDAVNFSTFTTMTSANKYCFSRLFENSMVYDISDLKLPATTLAEGCYQNMFNDCPYLINIPEFPATTLADYCYAWMFAHCARLTDLSKFSIGTSGTTMATRCCQSMFSQCNSLTDAPLLPATTLVDNCYTQIFKYNGNLKYVKCLATNVGNNSCYNWLEGVASTGTFITPNSTTWTSGDSGIPSGWTRVDA